MIEEAEEDIEILMDDSLMTSTYSGWARRLLSGLAVGAPYKPRQSQAKKSLLVAVSSDWITSASNFESPIEHLMQAMTF